MIDRKQLIEDAAKAILDAAGVVPSERYEEMWELARRDAEAALAVFEGAYTPTDDERALANALRHDAEHLRYNMRGKETDLSSRLDRAADLIAGFHRTVQGEPPCRYCGRPMPEHPGGVYCPAGPVQGEPGLDALGGFQGEPSDADTVLSELAVQLNNQAYGKDDFVWGQIQRQIQGVEMARAALRAAAETGGEHRG